MGWRVLRGWMLYANACEGGSASRVGHADGFYDLSTRGAGQMGGQGAARPVPWVLP
jgi:hypothetical protein